MMVFGAFAVAEPAQLAEILWGERPATAVGRYESFAFSETNDSLSFSADLTGLRAHIDF
jgi:hypothetical protein